MMRKYPVRFGRGLLEKCITPMRDKQLAGSLLHAFELSQNTHLKNQNAVVNVHSRTPLRALANVRSLSQDSVHPAHIQRYIARWASWWSRTVKISKRDLIFTWSSLAIKRTPDLAYLGQGLLDFLSISCLIDNNTNKITALHAN